MIELNKVYNLDGILLLERIYETYGEESVNMFLVDLPYTFKGKNRVTANKWDTPIDIEKFFELTSKLLTKDGCVCLTATQPFASYLIMKNMEMQFDKQYKDIDLVNFKYDWIWEKDNGSNFVHTKHQPMKVHEGVLIFGKAPTTYNKKDLYMKYNAQFTQGKPYKIQRDMSDVINLEGFKGRTDTDNKDGKRCPRTVQKVNLERGLHPTQKPTKLFEYMINTYTDEKDIVVDICCGSGTTAIACKNTNRNFIVNDLEEEYYNITCNRLDNY